MPPRRVVSCLSFNQDGSRLAVGVDGALAVFSTEPVSLESCSSSGPEATRTTATTTTVASTTSKKNSTPTSAALLFRTRVSAVVLASQPNVVSLHDDGGSKNSSSSKTSSSSSSSSLLGELSFPAPTKVLAVALRRDAVAVALSDGRAAAYSLEDSLRLLRSVETGPNGRGLLALAAGGTRAIFACPSVVVAEEEEEGGEEEEARGENKKEKQGLPALFRRKAQVSSRPTVAAAGEGTVVRVEFVDAGRSLFFRAARHRVAALALSRSGELLATASERGTLVRVFSLGDESNGSSSASGSASSSSSFSESALTPCLWELRRGGGPARMLSLAFSPSVSGNSSSSSAAPSSSSSSSTTVTKEEGGERRQQQQQQQQQQQPRPQWLAAASDKGTVHVWRLSPPPSRAASAALPASASHLRAAAAAATGAPSPSSLAAERSSFHFKLPGVFNGGNDGGDDDNGDTMAALSFAPGGKAVFATSATKSVEGERGSSRCGLVAVALPEEEEVNASTSTSTAAAELVCVPDLLGLLPRV